MNITNENLKTKLGFDIILELVSGIKYRANLEIELPCGDITEDGICKKEITDLNDIAFKRF